MEKDSDGLFPPVPLGNRNDNGGDKCLRSGSGVVKGRIIHHPLFTCRYFFNVFGHERYAGCVDAGVSLLQEGPPTSITKKRLAKCAKTNSADRYSSTTCGYKNRNRQEHEEQLPDHSYPNPCHFTAKMGSCAGCLSLLSQPPPWCTHHLVVRCSGSIASPYLFKERPQAPRSQANCNACLPRTLLLLQMQLRCWLWVWLLLMLHLVLVLGSVLSS